MLNEYPKMVSVGSERVRVENAEHERALTGGEPWSPPKAPSAAPAVPVNREYPKILTHPDSGERITVQNRDEEFHLRRFASEFQDRRGLTTEPVVAVVPDGPAPPEIVIDPPIVTTSKPAPRKRGRPAKNK